MTKTLKIGELVSLKNHPYNIFHNTLIGATSDLTPPIMVIAEYLNYKKYDTDSDHKQLIPSQYLCYFYSHKTASFEKFWFKSNEISKIRLDSDTNDNEEEKNDEQKSIIQSDIDIYNLKKEYINQLVILLSADVELGKKKTNWSKIREDDSHKTEAFLNFLPPVLTVIDVIDNKNYNTDRIDPKDGEIKKDSSKYFFKCKWFNPIKQTFSEEILPYKLFKKVLFDEDKLNRVREGIVSKNIFKLLPTQESEIIKLEGSGSTFSNSIIELKEVILLNHKIKVTFKNLINNKIQNSYLEKLEITDSKINFEKICEKYRFPDYKNSKYNNPLNLVWEKDKFYLIGYTDKKGKFTKRIITSASVENFITEDLEEAQFIVANCLLRDGHIRHFNAKKITERITLTIDLIDLLNFKTK